MPDRQVHMSPRTRKAPCTRRAPSTRRYFLYTMAVILLILLIIIFYPHFSPTHLQPFIAEQVSPGMFMVLMSILPVAGVPLSIFLVVVGMKFGILQGLLLSALAMLFHMTSTYFLVNSFLRDAIVRLLHYFNIPISSKLYFSKKWHAMIFMLIPGLPYAAKNILLALAGMPLAPYLLINMTTQFGLSIPFILLGDAVVQVDGTFVVIAILILLAGYALQLLVKRILQRNATYRRGSEDAAPEAKSKG